MSQVTPGGGALKIKLSKKKPLKITAGAPDEQSETILMELAHNWSPERIVPSSYVDSTSESTLPTRRSGAPLLISPILPENSKRPQKGTYIKGENDLKGSTGHGLVKERKSYPGDHRPVRKNISSGNGDGGGSSGGSSGDQRFPGEERGPPRRNGNQGGGGGDDDPDPSDIGG